MSAGSRDALLQWRAKMTSCDELAFVGDADGGWIADEAMPDFDVDDVMSDDEEPDAAVPDVVMVAPSTHSDLLSSEVFVDLPADLDVSISLDEVSFIGESSGGLPFLSEEPPPFASSPPKHADAGSRLVLLTEYIAPPEQPDSPFESVERPESLDASIELDPLLDSISEADNADAGEDYEALDALIRRMMTCAPASSLEDRFDRRFMLHRAQLCV